MSRMLSVLASTCIALLLVSCERPADRNNPPAPPPGTPTTTTTKTPSDVGIKPASEKASDTAREVPAVAKDMAKDLDPEAVLRPETTPEQLRQNVKNVSTDKLTSVADRLAASLENAGNAGGALEGIAKTAGVDVAALKEKLRVIVDELKARNIDVSKYTKFLGV